MSGLCVLSKMCLGRYLDGGSAAGCIILVIAFRNWEKIVCACICACLGLLISYGMLRKGLGCRLISKCVCLF